MILRDARTGIEVELCYDGDEFPIVSITTPELSYRDENNRPLVEIKLNGEVIRPLFSPEERETNVTRPEITENRTDSSRAMTPDEEAAWEAIMR